MKTRCAMHSLVLIVLAVTCLAGCSVYRSVFGKPTSFAFADGTAVASVPSTVSSVASVRSTVAARAQSEGLPDYRDYGEFAHRTWEADDILPILAEHATFVEAFTPDVFRIPMAKIGFLAANSNDGFWVLQGSEGIYEEMEYFDFTEPVYVTENMLWDRITYDMLFVAMGLSGGDIGGEPFTPDIQVHAPGFTDEDMPNTYTLLWSDATGGEDFTIKHYERKYLGDNRFALVGGELFHESVYLPNGEEAYNSPPEFSYGTDFLMFRNDIAKTRIYRGGWYITDEFDGLPAYPTEERFFDGNTWVDRPFAPGVPVSWIDIPFAGLAIGPETRELRVTIRWNLENIIELWDFGEDGLHFLFAPDFLDRFSVQVEQLE